MFMAVPMVQVGIMRVPMHKRSMLMPMGVWLARRIVRRVRVVVMFIVDVPMLVLHHVVPMLMLMAFREVRPQADRHQTARRNEPKRQGLAEQGK